MTMTTIGLIPDEEVAERAVHELETAGISSCELHVFAKPRYMPVTSMLCSQALYSSINFTDPARLPHSDRS